MIGNSDLLPRNAQPKIDPMKIDAKNLFLLFMILMVCLWEINTQTSGGMFFNFFLCFRGC